MGRLPHKAAPALINPADLARPGKSAKQCPALNQKIFRFTFCPNHLYIHCRPALTRGAFRDRHERWVRDAMDPGSAADESTDLADGEAVWS